MDPETARLSRITSAVAIGTRIKSARLAAGLTQEELAEGAASAAYVSRIEAGNRRAGTKLLTHLAGRLGTTVETLVESESHDRGLETELRLDYAELALKSGDAPTALADVSALLDAADPTLTPPLTLRAKMLQASALEVTGDLRSAMAGYEALAEESPRDLRWIGIVMALSRCYRESGDLARATKVGTDAVEEIERQGLAGTEEAIRLTVTVAGAYTELGDSEHALRLCETAAQDAAAIGSTLARASAYWNASIAQSRLGDVPVALVFAKRALAGMESHGDARAQGLLHQVLATHYLKLDPPEVEAAATNAAQALSALAWSDASAVEKAAVGLVLAKVAFARGQHGEARRLVEEWLGPVDEVAPSLSAHFHLLLGKIDLVEGGRERARGQFERAVQLLTASGRDRQAAQSWFEVGALLEEIGDSGGAMDAYRRAATSTGLALPQASHALT